MPPGVGPTGETDHGRYLRALRSSDGVFRQLVDKLKARGAYEDTLIVAGEAKRALVERLRACADYDLAEAVRPELAVAR